MTDSSITLGKNGTVCFHGSDAIKVYQAATLATHLKLWAKTKIIPTRGVTITKMLALAGNLTGKTYGRRALSRPHRGDAQLAH